ncbi:MAG: hypothetical protein IJ920_00780 [Paludibacteraceae bacterium]|nr:hypothetical protein [Paludibacteraceae bacterium]
MSRIVPHGLIESMSGLLCQHSDTYFFRKNGKIFTGKRCFPSKKEPTANQLAQRTKFAQARAAVKALTSEQKAAYMEAFKAQRRYLDFNGFLFAQEYAKLS